MNRVVLLAIAFACAFAAAAAANKQLLAVVGDLHQLQLVSLDPVTAKTTVIQDLTNLGTGSVGQARVDWKNGLLYMNVINHSKVATLVKTDLKGNVKSIIASTTYISSLERDVSKNSIFVSTYDKSGSSTFSDFAQADFSRKSLTKKFDFPAGEFVEGDGVTAYIQSSNTLIVQSSAGPAAPLVLNLINTNTWQRVSLPFDYGISAMKYCDEEKVLYATVYDGLREETQIRRISLPSLKSTTLFASGEFTYGGGSASEYDPTTGNYYTTLYDYDGNIYWLNVNATGQNYDSPMIPYSPLGIFAQP